MGVNIQLNQRILARRHKRAGHGCHKHIEHDKNQIARRGQYQQDGAQCIQRQAAPHGDPEFHAVQAMLDYNHEEQHDRRIQNRKQRQVFIGNPQPLGYIQAEEVGADDIGYVQNHRYGDRLHNPRVLQHLGNQLPVFPQHMQDGDISRLIPADFPLSGLLAETKGDQRLHHHCNGEYQIQHPKNRHNGKRIDEQP